MGAIDDSEIVTDLLHLEDVLSELGHRFERGAGVQAALSVFSAPIAG
jgi:hypothetical protein